MKSPSDTEENTRIDRRWGDATPTHDPYILAHFIPRATDVLITTAPKAGTTWMQQILHQLRSGGDTGFESIDRVVPWLELPRDSISWQQVIDRYENIQNALHLRTNTRHRYR